MKQMVVANDITNRFFLLLRISDICLHVPSALTFLYLEIEI
jgi:hypothetical protein